MKRSLSVAVVCSMLVACSFESVLSIIDIAIQATASILTALEGVSPADAAALTKVVNDANAGLTLLQNDYAAYETTCKDSSCDGSLLSEAQAVALTLQATLNNDLQTLHINDPATQAKVTAWATLVIDAAEVVLDHLPKVSDATTSAMIPVMGFYHGDKSATANSLKKRWDKEVCNNDKKCKSLIKVRKMKVSTVKGKL